MSVIKLSGHISLRTQKPQGAVLQAAPGAPLTKILHAQNRFKFTRFFLDEQVFHRENLISREDISKKAGLIFILKRSNIGKNKGDDMFIGHFGAALAAKKLDSKPSLGTMILASQFLDLLWPILMFAGVEKVKIEPGNSAFTPLNFIYYPFSHSLLFVLIWALLFGAVYFLIRKDIKSSFVLGLLVLSHWVLDLISHVPDLPLYPDSSLKVGLGLWNFVHMTVLVEGLIFIAGAFLYIYSTRALNKKGSIGLWSLLAFLVVIYITNMVSPPPPSVEAVAVVSLLQWLFVAWGYFIDRNRKSIFMDKPVLAGQ